MSKHNFEFRKAIYKKIEVERSSKVINYVTGDRPGMETQINSDVIDLFVDHLDELWPVGKLTLILYTSGGDTASAWQLINLLRTFCDELEIIVISKAHSAGTLMCLGANQILMTKQATLGPIDPSLHHPLGPTFPGGKVDNRVPVSVEAVQGYLDITSVALNIKNPDSLTQVLTHLSSQIHPLVLGQIYRTRNQIRSLAEKLLRYQGIEGDKMEAIVSFLCSDSGSHDHTINRREAKELGLIIDNPSDSFYRTLRDLHYSVSETLQLRSAFNAERELAGQNEAKYSLRRAMIESVSYGSHHFVSEGQLIRFEVVQPDQQVATGVQDIKLFEGWRKEA